MRQKAFKDVIELLIYWSSTIYCWAYSISLGVVYFYSETHLEKIKFSFSSSYQIEIHFGFGMGGICVHFSFHFLDHIWWPCACYLRLWAHACKICWFKRLCFLGFLHSFWLLSFSTSFPSPGFTEPWEKRFDSDITFSTEYSKIPLLFPNA